MRSLLNETIKQHVNGLQGLLKCYINYTTMGPKNFYKHKYM